MAVIKDGKPHPASLARHSATARKGYRDNARLKYYVPRYNDPLECFRDQRAYNGRRGGWRVWMAHFRANWWVYVMSQDEPSYGILTMQFNSEDDWYQVVRITGPTHNLLALKLGGLDAPEPIGRCSRPQSPRCGLPLSSASARNSR